MKKNYKTNLTQSLFFILVVFLIASTGCSSKRYMNKALELEQAGLITEAADLYLRSVQANDKNVDSKLGLKRTGQVLLDNKMEKFMLHYRNDQAREAVYTFRDADKYQSQIKNIGINLHFPEDKRIYYKEVKEIFLNQQYGKGLGFVEAEDFGSAIPVLNEILEIEPDYRDSRTHWNTARYEPVYRQGLSFLESGKYRSAYFSFDEILIDLSEYKDASSKKADAREKALITIGISTFTSARTQEQRTTSEDLRVHTTAQINHLNSPFYEIINSPLLDRSNIIRLLASKNSLRERGEKSYFPTNLNAILTGRISNYQSTTSALKKIRRKAWLKEEKEVVKEDGTKEKQTTFKKTYYYECSRSSKVVLGVSFSLTDVKTGKLMVSDALHKRMEDQILYGEFNGDHRKLVPGTWGSMTKNSDSDKVHVENSSIRELQSIFGSRKKLTVDSELKQKAIDEISASVAKKIIDYNPEI